LMIQSAERRNGTLNDALPVLDVTLRSADLFGRALAIGNIPLDAIDRLTALRGPQPRELIEALQAATRFQPQLVTPHGTLSGRPFDLDGQRLEVTDGRLESAQAIGGAAGGLF